MQLVFIDETSDSKNREYLGVCCAVINSYFYRNLKVSIQKILDGIGWDPAVEFKGELLFSQSKGCPSVSVEKRIEAAEKILRLNISQKNTRIKFLYAHKNSRNFRGDYLNLVGLLLSRGLPRPRGGLGRDIISVHCDEHSSVTTSDIQDFCKGYWTSKGYTLFEDVVLARSSYDTVGILYADLVGYLFGRLENIRKDEGIKDIPPDKFYNDGRIRKMRAAMKLLESLKEFDIYSAEF